MLIRVNVHNDRKVVLVRHWFWGHFSQKRRTKSLNLRRMSIFINFLFLSSILNGSWCCRVMINSIPSILSIWWSVILRSEDCFYYRNRKKNTKFRNIFRECNVVLFLKRIQGLIWTKFKFLYRNHTYFRTTITHVSIWSVFWYISKFARKILENFEYKLHAMCILTLYAFTFDLYFLLLSI